MPLPTATALALLLGGAVAVEVAGIGLWAIAEGSYPYAFGFDVRGDFPYPFHDAPAVWIGAMAVIVGLALGASLVGAARGRRDARWAGLGLLLVVMVGLGLVVTARSDSRRCGTDHYTGRQHCTSEGTAVVRDAGLFGALPAAAFVALALTPATRHRPTEPELPPQPL